MHFERKKRLVWGTFGFGALRFEEIGFFLVGIVEKKKTRYTRVLLDINSSLFILEGLCRKQVGLTQHQVEPGESSKLGNS